MLFVLFTKHGPWPDMAYFRNSETSYISQEELRVILQLSNTLLCVLHIKYSILDSIYYMNVGTPQAMKHHRWLWQRRGVNIKTHFWRNIFWGCKFLIRWFRKEWRPFLTLKWTTYSLKAHFLTTPVNGKFQGRLCITRISLISRLICSNIRVQWKEGNSWLSKYDRSR
jgi:hypothetical protein